jgi:hypothetical protein
LFIQESETASGGEPWSESMKKVAAACFISGAEWAASHHNPKQVLRDCAKAQKLFNKIPE